MKEKVVYSISYDLSAPNRSYDDLYTAIKSFGDWWHQSGSVWLIKTNKESAVIRDYLMQFIDGNDKIFVIEVKRNWAGFGFTEKEYNWIKSAL